MIDPPAHGSALRGKVLRYLAAHHVVTLATTEPWAAAVFYVNEGLRLYFLSSPRSRHARHLAADVRVAATIQEDQSDWRRIKGVQLEGAVHPLEQQQLARVRARYAAKFPVITGAAGSAAAIVAALARVDWYVLSPARLWFIDNEAGFGHRDELLPVP